MDIEFADDFAASASQTAAGLLAILSRVHKTQIHLMLIQNIEVKSRPTAYLKFLLASPKHYLPLDGISMRANISSAWGSLMTKHMMAVHRQLNRDSSDVVAYTAWRYSTLTAWGEASAARELALDLKVPVATIHNRLRLARERGILSSPGAGARLGGN
jgi:hypothetical protein